LGKSDRRGFPRVRPQKRKKGRRRGPGSRKGTSGARKPTKRNWIQTIRPLRQELRQLRDDGRITRSVYRSFYMKAKGGQFKNRKNLLSHLQTEGLLKEVK
jgi:large subunit ribosomal protein L19e